MRKLIIPVFFSAAAVSALLIISCTPGSCFEETNAYVKASFFLSETSKADAPDSLTLYGLGMNTSLVYRKALNIDQALMPLDASSDGCSFVIRINGVNDTISFVYSSSAHMISRECGYTFYHEIEEPAFTNNVIDDIEVVKSSITTLSEENIRIFY